MHLESLIEATPWFGTFAGVVTLGLLRPWARFRRASRHVALRALHRLLLSLFQAEELRRLLQSYAAGDGAPIAQYLPAGEQSADVLTSAALVALEQRGLIDRAFFDALVFERPRRGDEIRQVQRMFGL